LGTYICGMDEIRRNARRRLTGNERSLWPVPSAAGGMRDASGAKLVDVRTDAELHYVGSVPGSEAIEWNSFPEGAAQSDFLEQLGRRRSKDEPVMFLCRSGVRSHTPRIAATQAGWKEAYNVLEGFEGDKDAAGHRNTVGWRKSRATLDAGLALPVHQPEYAVSSTTAPKRCGTTRKA
jgi:rhodanese-related sulfurtransferase